jgi:hypothetical protein
MNMLGGIVDWKDCKCYDMMLSGCDLDTGYSGIAWQNFYDLGRRWIGAVQALHNTTEAEPLSLSYGNAKYASG